MLRMHDTAEKGRPEAVVMANKEEWSESVDTKDTYINYKRVKNTALFKSGCGFKGTYWSVPE